MAKNLIPMINSWVAAVNRYDLDAAEAALQDLETHGPSLGAIFRRQHRVVQSIHKRVRQGKYQEARSLFVQVTVRVRERLELFIKAVELQNIPSPYPIAEQEKNDVEAKPPPTSLQAFLEGMNAGAVKRYRRAVFKLLLRHLDKPVMRGAVKAHLWGESPPENADTILTQCISRLNYALHAVKPPIGSIISREDETYVLREAAQTVDPLEIRKEEIAAQLRRNQRLLFDALWKYRGHIVTYEQLSREIWGGELTVMRKQLIIGTIFKLKKHLRKLGVKDCVIEAHEGVGYQMHIAKPQEPGEA
jgi:DNA-binding response OmpR family regulator